MNSPNDTVKVAYCFDEKYAAYAIVATHSLFKFAVNPVTVYWIVTPGALSYAHQLKQLYMRSVDINIVCFDGEPFKKWKLVSHFTHAVYLRLAIPDLIQVEKIIYLDVDTIVTRDLKVLYMTPLVDKYIAAVPDRGGNSVSPIALSKDSVYINSGVLLLNCNALRKDGFLEKCKEIYEVHRDEIAWPDQCLINKFVDREKVVLPFEWNYQVDLSQMIQDKNKAARCEHDLAANRVGVIHFVGGLKPWSLNSIELPSSSVLGIYRNLSQEARRQADHDGSERGLFVST
jgi:lipopolysaccharide biosynthesis glycosyltransferase